MGGSGIPLARRHLIVPLAATAGLIAARVAAAPALSDPTGAALPPSLHLDAPWLYIALGPLFSVWDGTSMLSMTRLTWFLIGVALLYLLWRILVHLTARRRSWRREALVFIGAVWVLLLFLAGGLLWHRPMIALAGVPSDRIVADYHSHTSVSHDVKDTFMRGFDVAADLRWHRRAGFDAVFVTDHNTVEGLGPPASNPARCAGIEVSAWRAHVVLLGDSVPVDRSLYNGSLEELLTLLRTSDSAYGALSLLSLPEYDRNHWSRLDSLAAAGADGFEIVNASPKAADFSRARRDSVVALARRMNKFVAGVSDIHGWGATSLSWNLVTAPGWKDRQDADPCPTILGRLRTGFGANQIVERHHLPADGPWPHWLTPVGVVWETWRSMGTAVFLSWLVWLWGWWALRRIRR